MTVTYHLALVGVCVLTTGAALDGKNTSPEKLTTQDGRRFPRSNN